MSREDLEFDKLQWIKSGTSDADMELHVMEDGTLGGRFVTFSAEEIRHAAKLSNNRGRLYIEQKLSPPYFCSKTASFCVDNDDLESIYEAVLHMAANGPRTKKP